MGLAEAKLRIQIIAYTAPGLIKGEFVQLEEVLQILDEEFGTTQSIHSTSTDSARHKTKRKSGPTIVVVGKGLSEWSVKDTPNPPEERKDSDRLGTGKVADETNERPASAGRIPRPKQSRKGQKENGKKGRKSPAKAFKRCM